MYGKIKTIDKLNNIANKRVIVRVDFNVPMKNGTITDTTRVDAAIKTINYLVNADAKIILMSHLGRIKSKEDIKSGEKSLKSVADYLNKVMKNEYKERKIKHKPNVIFNKDNLDPNLPLFTKGMTCGDILVLENTRYADVDSDGNVTKAESKCNMQLAKQWARYGDVFVNDAFGTAHRKHASNYGIARLVKARAVGFLITKEIEAIDKLLLSKEKPFVGIIGGAKIADKISLINTLCEKCDMVLIGGGMALTFAKAHGMDIGKSICEDEMLKTARRIYKKHGNKILLPIDFKTTYKFADKPGANQGFDTPWGDEMGLDIGTESIEMFVKTIYNARVIFWNGPAGVFEFENYAAGTKAICDAICERTKVGAYAVIGGGDSVAAVKKYKVEDKMSFISTGGGASLTLIQGSKMPALDIILNKK